MTQKRSIVTRAFKNASQSAGIVAIHSDSSHKTVLGFHVVASSHHFASWFLFTFSLSFIRLEKRGMYLFFLLEVRMGKEGENHAAWKCPWRVWNSDFLDQRNDKGDLFTFLFRVILLEDASKREFPHKPVAMKTQNSGMWKHCWTMCPPEKHNFPPFCNQSFFLLETLNGTSADYRVFEQHYIIKRKADTQNEGGCWNAGKSDQGGGVWNAFFWQKYKVRVKKRFLFRFLFSSVTFFFLYFWTMVNWTKLTTNVYVVSLSKI
jgi:hypothetical protein